MTGLPLLGEVILAVILAALGLGSWYVKDRRKSRAETAVAERTVQAQVATHDVGALQATVAYVQEAFRVERESKDRQINDLSHEVQELTHEVETLRRRTQDDAERIAALRGEIQELREQVSLLTALTQRLSGKESEEI